MFIFIRKIVIIVVFLSPTSSLLADNLPPEDICSSTLTNEDLVGIYTITMGPGIMSMGSMTMPFPETPKSPAKIFEINNKLAITSDDGHFDMILTIVGESEVPWHFSSNSTFMSYDSDDIGLALGCKTLALPRISGNGWFISKDNVKVPSMMRLIVFNLSENGLNATGVMYSSGQGVNIKVRISLETEGLH